VKQVEDNKTSSSTTSNGKHGAAVGGEPTRRRIASEGLHRICRHLGRNFGPRPGPVTNNEGKNSIHKDSYLKQPRLTVAKDSDHKMESLVSASSSCSLGPKDQTEGSAGSDQLLEESFIEDHEYTSMLEEYSLPTSFGKPNTYQPRQSNSIQNSLKRGAGGGNKGSRDNKSCIAIEPFDICRSESEELLIRQSHAEDHPFPRSSVDMEVESVPEKGRLIEWSRQRVLRPGMVLLKNYITHSEQVL